jgi:predicted O-methyltransferase YrrM
MPSRFGSELDELWPLIEAAKSRWEQTAGGGTVRGRPHVFGEVLTSTAIALYDLVREHHPEHVVETGVCNGVSTAVLLWALERNGSGHLWSIDLPDYAGQPSDEHWAEKGGSVIPAGLEPGWIVPDHLRHRWTLTLGRTQDRLEEVLERAAPVDMFIHDSEHSYECMRFELELARRHVRPGGWLLADDAHRNSAFAEQARGLRSLAVGEVMRACRLPASRWPAWRRQRPTVVVAVNARDAEDRLPRLLDEAATFADEIVVGVDDASTDGTFDVARSGADTVYRFRHDGEPSPARVLTLDYTTCDWVLLLDDDEGVDAAFPDVLGQLVADERYTHWWLLRKWVVGLDPLRHLEVSPWFPDFQLRLFRADPKLVWKPIGVHTGLRVMGPSGREVRTSLLHYEPLTLDDDARAVKLERYRRRGSGTAQDGYYVGALDAPSVVSTVGPLVPRPRPRSRLVRIELEPVDLARRPQRPPWQAEVVNVQLPATAAPGEMVHGIATARNTGGLAWPPPSATPQWPIVHLGYRTTSAAGEPLAHPGLRTPIPTWVDPGSDTTLLCSALAPEEPGDYVLEWQLVSGDDVWFSDGGSAPARTALRVTA